jgi:hypothetical protein
MVVVCNPSALLVGAEIDKDEDRFNCVILDSIAAIPFDRLEEMSSNLLKYLLYV